MAVTFVRKIGDLIHSQGVEVFVPLKDYCCRQIIWKELAFTQKWIVKYCKMTGWLTCLCCVVSCCDVLNCVLWCIELCCDVLSCVLWWVECYIVLCHVVMCWVVVCCDELYCIVLWCIVLWCDVLCFTMELIPFGSSMASQKFLLSGK